MDIFEGSSNSGDSVDGDDESGPDDEDEFAQQMSDSDLPDTERQPKRKGVKVVSDTKGGKKGKGVQGGRSQSSVIEPDKGSGRQLVDGDHVGKLVRDYRKYMDEFSKGRKKKIKQLIPNKVWLKIFRDYKLVYLSSPFYPGSLKDHLRTALKEMTYGDSDPEKGDGAEPQDEDVMVALMQTKSWKARNVLKTRNSAFDGSSVGSSMNSSASGKVLTGSLSTVSATPIVPKDSTYAKLATKKEHLKRAGEDISQMLSEFKDFRAEQGVDPETKRQVTQAKVSLSHARREESEARRNLHSRQNTMAEVTLLKEQRALGLITEDQFKEKCKVVFGI